MFELGKGVVRCPETAFLHYQAAAIQEDAEGLNNLGRMYENGLGTIVSLDAAIICYQAAAAQEDPEGINNLRRIYDQNGMNEYRP